MSYGKDQGKDQGYVQEKKTLWSRKHRECSCSFINVESSTEQGYLMSKSYLNFQVFLQTSNSMAAADDDSNK